MLFGDPYAGNRKWWDWEWVPDHTSKDWTTWDYILASAYQVILDYTDDESGQIMWFDQSGEVDWEVESVTSESLAEIERVRESRKEMKPGERLYATPVFRDPDNKPTLKSWLDDIAEGKSNRPANVRNARPPTAAELAALDSQMSSPLVN